MGKLVDENKEKLKALYKSKGLTQRDLADKMGMSVTNFNNFFNRNPIPFDFIYRALDALGIKPNEFETSLNDVKTDKDLLLDSKDEVIKTKNLLIEKQNEEIDTLKGYVESLRLNNDLLRKQLDNN